MTRTIALIQARMGSTRLPGKILMDIGGRAMLGRVVRRVKRATRVTDTVVATSTGAQDNAVEDYCQGARYNVFRGSEENVLDRFYRAALEWRAETVVRITADCPFIDPEVIDEVILAFDASEADYSSNTLERSYPRGLDVEAFSFHSLSEAAGRATEAHQRVHVTPFIYENPNRFRLHSVAASIDYSHFRLTVDQIEDLKLARLVYERLGNRDTFGWMEAIAVLETEPELTAVNRDVVQKGLFEG